MSVDPLDTTTQGGAMHDILLPENRLVRLRNTYRYPAQATLAARLPVIGRRVPMRGFWRSRRLGTARMAETALTAVAGTASAAATMSGRGILAGAQRVRGMEPQARTVAHRAADAARTATDRASDAAHAARERAAATAQEAAKRAHVARESAATATHIANDGREHVAAHTYEMRERAGFGRTSFQMVLGVFAAGALLMYLVDPAQGRRRRALLRDRAVHFGHVFSRLPSQLSRRGRAVRGPVRGVRHGMLHLVRSNPRVEGDDAETLVARVRSEVLRDGRFKAGEINIDAYEGCVTLRGQFDRDADIRWLIDATKRVEGVSEVRSYLHLPDQLPPNKAEVYEQAARHLPSM